MAFSFLMSLTEDQFKDYLKEGVKEALKESDVSSPNNLSSTSGEDFLTIKQASQYTHIPVGTLYGYTHRKKIPFNKVGKKLLFSKTELTEWVNLHHRKTRSEI